MSAKHALRQQKADTVKPYADDYFPNPLDACRGFPPTVFPISFAGLVTPETTVPAVPAEFSVHFVHGVNGHAFFPATDRDIKTDDERKRITDDRSFSPCFRFVVVRPTGAPSRPISVDNRSENFRPKFSLFAFIDVSAIQRLFFF